MKTLLDGKTRTQNDAAGCLVRAFGGDRKASQIRFIEKAIPTIGHMWTTRTVSPPPILLDNVKSTELPLEMAGDDASNRRPSQEGPAHARVRRI